MRELELKDIAAYLPYGMNFINKDGVILRMDALQVSGYNVWAHQRYVKGKKDERDINYPYLKSLNCSGEGDYLRRIKPILRPMSDLTKSIVVKGYNDDKEFVPLAELKKTAYKEVYDGYVTNESVLKEIEPNPKSDGSYMIDNFSFKDGMFEMLEYGEVIKRNKKDEEPFVEIVHTPLNQCNYYDLLNQWNFDYRNLIGEGLAIDINTLN